MKMAEGNSMICIQNIFWWMDLYMCTNLHFFKVLFVSFFNIQIFETNSHALQLQTFPFACECPWSHLCVRDHTWSHMFVCIHDHMCMFMSMIPHVYVHRHLCRRICVLEPVPSIRCLPQLILHLRHWDKVFYLSLELIDLTGLTRQLALGILPLSLTLGLQMDEPGIAGVLRNWTRVSCLRAYSEQHPSLEFIVFENEWKWWTESWFAFLSRSPGRPQACNVAINGLKLRILSLPPKC